jgi:hypothetical protein
VGHTNILWANKFERAKLEYAQLRLEQKVAGDRRDGHWWLTQNRCQAIFDTPQRLFHIQIAGRIIAGLMGQSVSQAYNFGLAPGLQH